MGLRPMPIKRGTGQEDVLRLIDSRDVREHLRRIGWRFCTADRAYVIFRCRHITSEERLRLWEKLARSARGPVAEILPAVTDAHRRVGPERDDNPNWDCLAEEDRDLLRLPNRWGFSFPSPFAKGELLHAMWDEGIFRTCPLRLLEWDVERDRGPVAVCAYRDGLGKWRCGGIPLLMLERYSTFLARKTKQARQQPRLP